MLAYLKSFIWKEVKGPRVAAILLSGKIAPSSPNPVQDRSLITFDKVKQWADLAFAVPNVRAVALSITCPGGAPTQTEKIHDYLRLKSKAHNVPILAFANDVAASGGYWLMCAGDELYACKTSLVGSIGVVAPSFGFVEALKKLGVERRILKAGESKASMDVFSPVTDEQRALTGELMACLHSSFIDVVKDRRKGKLKLEQDTQLFSGRVWTGEQAQGLGLVDSIGVMDSVLAQKFGHDVNVLVFGSPKSGGFFSWASYMHAGRSDHVESTVDALWSAIQTRLLWARYGL